MIEPTTTFEASQFENFEVFRQDKSFVYSSGYLRSIQAHAVLKMPLDPQSSPSLLQLKFEKYILKKLKVPGIANILGVTYKNNSFGIVMEYRGIENLKDRLEHSGPLSFQSALHLALELVQTLSNIHQQHIIHKAISPTNIYFFEDKPYITCFGSATDCVREHIEYTYPYFFEHHLPYISPEQTGRMNREIDYRTDFYSLGATLYHALSGKQLFVANDFQNWVHCHLALSPVSLDTLLPEIPAALNAVIMRLLEKSPEDRYQTIEGLMYDLEYCLHDIQHSGEKGIFTTGTKDQKGILHLPKKLYGRQKEVNHLLQNFEHICKGNSALVMLKGFSGIGKTSVIREIYTPVTAKRGFFLTGKSTPIRQNTPYSSFMESFKTLTHRLLSSPPEELAVWQTKIKTALGRNSQLLIDALPELGRIIGYENPDPQDRIPEYSDTRNRFELTIRAFIKVFSEKIHPLVIFLDDVQWIDSASLKLIKALMDDPEQHYLLMICAYRDNEIQTRHTLFNTLHFFENSSIHFSQIEIKLLTISENKKIVEDMLATQDQYIQELNELIFFKTAGNPFFTIQLIQTLFKENLLWWSKEHHKWQWSKHKIDRADISEDVLALMTRILVKLPAETLELVKLAACIGNKFTLRNLQSMCSLPKEVIHHCLVDQCQHLVIPVQSSFSGPEYSTDIPNEYFEYIFMHDRIQQAAYNLISELTRFKHHRTIAQAEMQSLNQQQIQERLFFITDHFNRGYPALELHYQLTDKERQTLLRLNFQAGEKALQSSAFGVALHYFNKSIALLNSKSWLNQYEETLELYTLAAEAAMCLQETISFHQFITTIKSNAASFIDCISAVELEVKLATQQNKLFEALAIGKKTLSKLDVDWSQCTTENDLDVIYTLVAQEIHSKSAETLVNMPKLENKKDLAIIRTLVSLIESTRGSCSLLFQLTVLSIMRLSLTHSHPYSGFAFACYGLLLCSVKKDFRTGVRMGDLAINIAKAHPDSRYYARTLFVVNSSVRCFGPPFVSNLTGLREAFEVGFEIGDLNYAGHANLQYIIIQIFIGTPLTDIFDNFEIYIPRFSSLGLDFDKQFLMPWYQFTYNLLHLKHNAEFFSGPYFQESTFDFIEEVENKMHPFSAFSARAYLQFILGYYEQAYSHLLIAHKYLGVMGGLIQHHQHNFIFALCHLHMARQYPENREFHTHEALILLARLESLSENASANFYNKVLLIKAELARNHNDFASAARYYNQAIACAEDNNFIQEQAFTHELAAHFFKEHGHQKVFVHSLLAARNLYRQWGALSKVQLLEDQYDFLVNFKKLHELTDQDLSQMRLQLESDKNQFDSITCLKLSQLISREVDIDKLPPLLMNIMATNAGADRGCLLTLINDQLVIEAAFPRMIQCEYTSNSFDSWSSTAIHYVLHSHESLLVDDAAIDIICCTDPYIHRSQVKSIMCIPILDKNRLLGILYLENSHSTHVFTQSLVHFMQVIASQAAITMENCRLFSELQHTEKALHAQADLYHSILNSIDEGIVSTDRDMQTIYFNPAAKKIYGIDSDSLPFSEWMLHYNFYEIHDRTQKIPFETLPLPQALLGHSIEEKEYFLHCNKNSKGLIVTITACPIYDDEGNIRHAVAVIRDISERKEREFQMKHMATHDPLTQLPNRALFIKRLYQSVEKIQSDRIGALLFLDLDNFKDINDSLGHDVGDALLKAVSQRLLSHIKITDTVARLGGDEFGILIHDLQNIQQAGMITQRIIDTVLLPVDVDGQVINTSISIGITLFPQDGNQPSQLLKNADIAMYCSKNAGRNTFSFFTKSMNDELNYRKNIGNQLQQALIKNELVIFYQPLMSAKSNSIISYEALLRWPHMRETSPSLFISIAEQYGLIHELSDWILIQVCQDIAKLTKNNSNTKVSINISPLHLKNQDFVKTIENLILKNKINPSNIEFEITESAALFDLKNTLSKLNSLKQLGIQLTLDDFGTGYSSLNYLKQLPISKVKIDHSFIADMITNKENANVVKAIINLAHSLKIDVVAEGVETQAQFDLLQQYDCDLFQGYYFSHPKAISNFL